MSYEPREGVDYIVDLYKVAGVEQDADSEAVRQAVRERLREYHPDRLQGLAPEFQSTGERMARLLNRAKVILLDPDKRSEYDHILSAWEGPVSKDGTPIVKLEDALRAEAAQKTPEELEAAFSEQRLAVASMVHHDPKQQAMLKRLLGSAEGTDAEELREAYDDALLAEDRVLAIEEADRGRLLGLSHNERYETAVGYADQVALAIESARTNLAEDYQRRALGSVGIRLALMAGETTDTTAGSELTAATGELPEYFDEQAKKVAELASQREALLEQRLELFQPTYPIADIQTEAKPNFVIGITNKHDNSRSTWIGFSFDAQTMNLENIAVPETVKDMLTAGEYESVYRDAGFNILTFDTRDHIDIQTLLEEAYRKHLQKFYPDVFGGESEE